MARQFPVPGQQLGDAPGRVVLEARQHIGQPGLRICVVELGGLDQGVDGCSAPAAGIGAGEGPVIPQDADARLVVGETILLACAVVAA